MAHVHVYALRGLASEQVDSSDTCMHACMHACTRASVHAFTQVDSTDTAVQTAAEAAVELEAATLSSTPRRTPNGHPETSGALVDEDGQIVENRAVTGDDAVTKITVTPHERLVEEITDVKESLAEV